MFILFSSQALVSSFPRVRRMQVLPKQAKVQYSRQWRIQGANKHQLVLTSKCIARLATHQQQQGAVGRRVRQRLHRNRPVPPPARLEMAPETPRDSPESTPDQLMPQGPPQHSNSSLPRCPLGPLRILPPIKAACPPHRPFSHCSHTYVDVHTEICHGTTPKHPNI